jgi:hypothetical protein
MRLSLRSCLALAAACVLLASCASEPVALSPAMDFRPVPRSALASSPELNFVVAQQARGAELMTVLARRQAGAPPLPVARLVQVRSGPASHVSVQRLPASVNVPGRSDQESASLALAALEQLYALLLRQEPQARYCLGSGDQPCDAQRDGVSHGQVLQALAEAREGAAGHAPAAVPWRLVEMTQAPVRSGDADLVGVRAMAQHGPLEGVAIYFNRPPHSLCIARTRADGVAVCRLVDQHGDEHEHDHAARVVATFPGDVRRDRVLLPTTHVLPAPGVLPPAFAPRLSGVLPVKP